MITTKTADFGAQVFKFCFFLFLSLLLINLTIEIIINQGDLPLGTFKRLILILFCGGAWLLNSKGLNPLSSIIFWVGVYFTFFLYPVILPQYSYPPEDIFLYPIVILTFNILGVVLLELKTQWITFIWISITTLTYPIAHQNSLAALDSYTNQILLNGFFTEPLIIYLIIISSLFLSFVTWNFKKKNDEIKSNLINKTSELRKQNQLTTTQNHQLLSSQEEMERVHVQLEDLNSSLSERVKSRKEKLNLINLKILKNGFFHSKSLKRSFSQFLEIETKIYNMDDEDLKNRYSELTNNLDELVQNIGDNLAIADSDLQ